MAMGSTNSVLELPPATLDENNVTQTLQAQEHQHQDDGPSRGTCFWRPG